MYYYNPSAWISVHGANGESLIRRDKNGPMKLGMWLSVSPAYLYFNNLLNYLTFKIPLPRPTKIFPEIKK